MRETYVIAAVRHDLVPVSNDARKRRQCGWLAAQVMCVLCFGQLLEDYSMFMRKKELLFAWSAGNFLLSLSLLQVFLLPSWSFDLARPVFSLSFIDWSFLFFFLFTRSEKSKVPARRQRPEERKVRAVAWLFLSVAVSQFGWVPAGRFGPPRRKLVLLLPGAEISRL